MKSKIKFTLTYIFFTLTAGSVFFLIVYNKELHALTIGEIVAAAGALLAGFFYTMLGNKTTAQAAAAVLLPYCGYCLSTTAYMKQLFENPGTIAVTALLSVLAIVSAVLRFKGVSLKTENKLLCLATNGGEYLESPPSPAIFIGLFLMYIVIGVTLQCALSHIFIRSLSVKGNEFICIFFKGGF